MACSARIVRPEHRDQPVSGSAALPLSTAQQQPPVSDRHGIARKTLARCGAVMKREEAGGPCSPLRTVLRVPFACLQGRTGNFRCFRMRKSAFRCRNPLNSCLFLPKFPVTNNREFRCRNRVLESASRESGLACREPRCEEQRTSREQASDRGSRGASGRCS